MLRRARTPTPQRAMQTHAHAHAHIRTPSAAPTSPTARIPAGAVWTTTAMPSAPPAASGALDSATVAVHAPPTGRRSYQFALPCSHGSPAVSTTAEPSQNDAAFVTRRHDAGSGDASRLAVAVGVAVRGGVPPALAVGVSDGVGVPVSVVDDVRVCDGVGVPVRVGDSVAAG